MKRGLGRGLGSLFADYEKYDVQETQNEVKKTEKSGEEQLKDGVIEIEIGLIDRNENQPRKNFDEKALKELAQSIKAHGIIQPLILQKTGDRYQIVAGERRFRAARMAGLKKVPAIIRQYEPEQMSEISIIENCNIEN